MSGKSYITRTAAAISVAVLLFMSNSAYAFREQKPYKMDISLSVTAGVASTLENRFQCGFNDASRADDKRYPDVEHYYADYLKEVWASTPLFSLKADVKVLKWLTVGGNLSYQQIEGTAYHGFQSRNTKSVDGRALYIMPEVRFDYFRTKLSTLSSAVSVGVGIYEGFEHNFYPEFQVYPIQYSIGNVVYGKVALSLGTLVNGVEFGVGIRF